VIIGPAAGVGEATARNLLALARTGAALVVDADALTSFRHDPEALFACLDRDDVLTPHPGEFERIFPGLLARSPERITAVREAAKRAGRCRTAEGPDTVVAAPDGRAAVSLNGTPWLATAGSGDVLAGFIGGLIAQGMESFEAACAGAWIHAGLRRSPRPRPDRRGSAGIGPCGPGRPLRPALSGTCAAGFKSVSPTHADVAKLVDALDLGSSAERRGGSSPLIRTRRL
jgi:hypothetical protein